MPCLIPWKCWKEDWKLFDRCTVCVQFKTFKSRMAVALPLDFEDIQSPLVFL